MHVLPVGTVWLTTSMWNSRLPRHLPTSPVIVSEWVDALNGGCSALVLKMFFVLRMTCIRLVQMPP